MRLSVAMGLSMEEQLVPRRPRSMDRPATRKPAEVSSSGGFPVRSAVCYSRDYGSP
jgi:hypothetical protein